MDKEKISIRQMVDNPTGKGSGYVAARFRIKQSLNSVYVKNLRNHRKIFFAMPYVYPDGKVLYWVKVPSESYKLNRVSYDCLIEISNDTSRRFSLRPAKFFSNAPSFIFTYAYVFNKKGLMIDFIKGRLPQECLNVAPKVRNPIESLGYDKILYQALRYLLDGGCLTEGYILKYGKNMNPIIEQDLYSRVSDPHTLISIYQHAKYMHAKTHRKELSEAEKRRREERQKKYIRFQKMVRPEVGKIIKRQPRAKITAKKAERMLLNDKENKTPKIIKAKAKIKPKRKL